jgi:uncharacterized membrane protein
MLLTGMISILADAPNSPWLQTMGRMHVVVVHFPIALLLVAGAIELWRSLRRSPAASPTAIACLILGALGGAVSIAMGYLHQGFGNYGGEQLAVLRRHEWLGYITIGVAIACLLPLVVHRYNQERRTALRVYRYGAVLCAALVAVTGHFGGTLTHGPGYLTELVFAPAPDPNVNLVAVSLDDAMKRTVKFPADGKIDFIRDVQPVFAQSCYECHGPSKRRGALRLDNKPMTFEGGNSGPAIVIGDSKQSNLIKRVLGEGHEKRMPIGKPPLPDEQIRILKAWIDQGAKWPDHASNEGGEEETHWAYVKPVRPALPQVKNAAWPRNGIDHFVLGKLEAEGLAPSAEADRPTLIRRASLDLIGLPPTPEEVDAFVADQSPDAFEKVVDRLLASPHYGERWGRHWLDIARYADTNGYEKDKPRVIWPYRDWVIKCINEDLPYDLFVIHQMAGDMLPGATPDQKIATGFHRNTMFNEEGGIDVEEFRYKAVVDRVQTTGTAFMGLTLHCAQCHNHKYDKISHQEYFSFFALLNDADEPELDIPDSAITAQRDEIAARVATMEAGLAQKFPYFDEGTDWQVLTPDKYSAANGTTLGKQPDNSVLAGGTSPETETYTVTATLDFKQPVTSIKLEALTDPSLPKNGPGRAKNGNFVLTEFRFDAKSGDQNAQSVAVGGVKSNVEQSGFPATNAIDGNPSTGWAVATSPGQFNIDHWITFELKEPIPAGPTTLTFTLDQQFKDHLLGRFRLSAGSERPAPAKTDVPVEEQRKRFLELKLTEWEKSIAPKCSEWTVIEPVKYERRHGATIKKLNDQSLLFTGDNFYRDEYELQYRTDATDVTAIRLEVLPHESQPRGGPGRSPRGGFLLSEFEAAIVPPRESAAATQPTTTTTAPAVSDAPASGEATPRPAGTPIALAAAVASTAADSAARAIDGRKDTHWTVPKGDGEPMAIVFRLKEKLTPAEGEMLALSIVQNYHQDENLGRVRVSVTSDPGEIDPSGVPAEIEQIIRTPREKRTPEQAAAVTRHFLQITPLLGSERAKIDKLRNTMPKYQTTMVMQERPKPRVTRRHHRGEFLDPREQVQPGVMATLPPLPAGETPNRLTLARWLVDQENPLIGRVTMNRIWATYFGRGIVNTVEDFGVMGEKPSHPELLDWLATELPRQRWSMKAMHRLIVTSATYRQSSRVTPELLQRDPVNLLLTRGPRLRVEAEIVRDVALSASGLLDRKIGGPSVFPPQPPGVSELSYGPMAWKVSEGSDKYRRGLYTFLKRTAMYPGLTVFDAPTSEVTCVRRIRSNTPLQALTTLNDDVFVEAAQALGRRLVESASDPRGRIALAFRLCVGRHPDETETKEVEAFYTAQLARFRDKSADAAAVALADPKAKPPEGMDLPEVAAWTTVARAILNLDETVTRE